VERKNVFNLLSDEKLLSAVHVVTGMHKNNVMRRFTCGKMVDQVGLSVNSTIKSEMVDGGLEIFGIMFSSSVSARV